MILHVDMDAFFASVEQLDNPALRGKCVVVGGQSDRGVVAAASYEARKYGIHSAMPIFQARQKCSDLVIVPPRRERYSEISRTVMTLLRRFSPLVETVSIDEAYVDISGCRRLFGPPIQLAEKLKNTIKETVRLSCSVGIAPNKFLAKIASDLEKPDGLTVITPDEAPAFIEALPIRKVPGVGAATHKTLCAMGIQTLGDIRRLSEAQVHKRLGKFGRRLMALSHGIDESPVTVDRAVKSVSSEETLDVNTSDKQLLKQYLLKQSEDVGRQLRRKGVKARAVAIKIKHADFRQVTRSTTLHNPTQSSETLYNAAKSLLAAYTLPLPVRLIGVGATGLMGRDVPVQATLFKGAQTDDDSWLKIDEAVDAITDKYGKGAVEKASLQKRRK